MENSKADKQTDTNMTLLEMEDTLGRANAMVSFIASTLLMASNCPSEIDEDWFGELSLYASDAADVLESVVDWFSATRRDAEILGLRDAEILGLM